MAEPRVFVSYSHKEADWAREFAQALSQRRLQVWIDQLAVDEYCVEKDLP
jgi:hypothetical protein